MDKVVVAAPAIKEPEMVDVFGFNAEEILEAFDHELARLKKRTPGLSPKAPIFLALDGKRGRDPAPPENEGGLDRDGAITAKSRPYWRVIGYLLGSGAGGVCAAPRCHP